MVRLAADIWGFRGSAARLVIKEKDPGLLFNTVTTLQATATGDKIDVKWKADYVDDKTWTPLGWVWTDDEFYFTLTIEDLECTSELIEVPPP
jgi:hypothetical protein